MGGRLRLNIESEDEGREKCTEYQRATEMGKGAVSGKVPQQTQVMMKNEGSDRGVVPIRCRERKRAREW